MSYRLFSASARRNIMTNAAIRLHQKLLNRTVLFFFSSVLQNWNYKCNRTARKVAQVFTDQINSTSHMLRPRTGSKLQPVFLPLKLGVKRLTRMCARARLQPRVRAGLRGASTHPRAIRERISEASIVILNGSRPL